MSIELIIGPMFSGKSTELLRRLNICAEMDLRVLYVNSSLDDRTSTSFSTHNPTMTSVGKIKAIKAASLEGLDPDTFDVIGIDEAQFIPNLKKDVVMLAESYRKQVLIAGLDGDFNRNKFGEIIDLIPLCDSIDKLFPFCTECWKRGGVVKKALFSFRTSDAGTSAVVAIGAGDIYSPLCRRCYMAMRPS